MNKRATETKLRLRRLYDAIESGVADLDDPVLKDRIDRLKATRDQARADAERASALLQSSARQAITPTMLRSFARTARQCTRLPGGGYRRDHLRALAQRVEVDVGEDRIMGSKSNLLRLLSANGVATAGGGVPTVVPKWRRGCLSSAIPECSCRFQERRNSNSLSSFSSCEFLPVQPSSDSKWGTICGALQHYRMLGGALAMSGFKPTGRHREKVLTAATVRAIRKPGLHADGNNLYLKVDDNGAKRWVQRVTIKGKRRELGLGSAKLVSLAEARDLALANLKAARSGGDPIADKRQASAILTFKEASEKVHALDAPHWKNEKHAAQWISSMREYVFPNFGDVRITDVGSGDVQRTLEVIWADKPETARRVKQRIGRVFKWAMAQGWRTDNPAETAAVGLPRHDRSKVRHHPALPYSDVPRAIQTVSGSAAAAATKLAFEFLVQTATRSNEVRLATWGEVDFERALWIIPKERMKAKREHRVPLSHRCIAVLRQAQALRDEPGAANLIFPGSKPDKPISDMTLSKLMKELKIAAVPHGFRSSFRDWAGESTAHPREVIEFALAHTIKDKAEAAYARSDLLVKRKKLMDDWSEYLTTQTPG